MKSKPYLVENSPEIAIVGMSGVFPCSKDLNQFWENLIAKKDLISPIPQERKELYLYNTNSSTPVYGGFVDSINRFDYSFFGISRREAEVMDPQQRVAIQIVWKAIEDAGYRVSDLSRKMTGIFFAVSNIDHSEIVFKSGVKYYSHTATGITHSMIPNRISYLFDLHGPSIQINTACSSSLVAIHYAIKSILTGDCNVAIVGGVNALLSPFPFISFTSAGMLSKDGKCKTFDKHANGYVRGEGAGAVILKPLQDAINDHDHIYAVIKGSFINHGGKAKTLTSPNVFAQSALLYNTYVKSGISPDTVTYIETHGTGTPLGDPIEINALQRSFRQLEKYFGVSKIKKPYCGLGSVKTNIGHLEAAAGIAGLIKIILAMMHKTLPATIHFSELNPHIKMAEGPFYIVDQTKPWERTLNAAGEEIPRRAGLSSFGFGGVNAHIILEEFEPFDNTQIYPHTEQVVFVISAKTKERLLIYAQEWLDFLENKNSHSLNLNDLAFTVQCGREPLPERFAVIVSSLTQLKEELQIYCRNKFSQTIFRENENSESSVQQIEQITKGANREEYIKTLIKNNNLKELAYLWMRGVDIDWRQLYSTSQPKRIPLPTYPFEEKECWLQYDLEKSFFAMGKDLVIPGLIEKKLPKKPDTDCEESIDQLYYRPYWRRWDETNLKSKPTASSDGLLKRKVLIVYTKDSIDLAEEWGSLYESNAVKYLAVDELTKGNELKNTIKEFQLPHDKLLQRPLLLFLGAFHNYNVDLNVTSEEFYPESGLLNLFQFIKLVHEDFENTPIQLAIVTNKCCQVIPEEKIRSFDAGVQGFSLSLAREFPKWQIRCIDIDTTEVGIMNLLTPTVLNLCFKAGNRILWAFRNGHWYYRTLIPLVLEAPKAISFRNEGVYLIIGGKGTVGFSVAQQLLQKVNARVALIGRSKLSDCQSERIKKAVLFGGKLLYLQADVTDYQSLSAAINEVERQWGQVHGVFHSAMVLNTRKIIDMDEDFLKKIIAPKIRGSILLYKAFCKKSLDFIFFFSSIQSFTGNIGQSAYAAGSAFEDAFAVYVNGLNSFPTHVINWGYLSGNILTENERDERAFKELGFASADLLNNHLKKFGFNLINIDEAITAIETMIHCGIDQVIAVKVDQSQQKQLGVDLDLKAVFSKQDGLKIQTLNHQSSNNESGERNQRMLSDNQSAATKDGGDINGNLAKIEQKLTMIVAEILHVEEKEIELTVPFVEFGLDSLLVVEFTDNISNYLHISLNATIIFNYPNIKDLARYINENFNVRFDEGVEESLQTNNIPKNYQPNDEIIKVLFEKIEKNEMSVDEAMEYLEGC